MNCYLNGLNKILAIIKVKFEGEQNRHLYKKFGFKTAKETIKECKMLKGIIESYRDGYSYMYYATETYPLFCKMMSMLS